MGAIITVDLAALQRNFTQVKHYAPHSAILAMIKSNAYGHGILQVARCLAQADAFGVASIAEAMLLRSHNINNPIVIMSGIYTAHELATAREYNLDIVVHSYEQIALLTRAKPDKTLRAWLKINTGMNRLGIDIELLQSHYAALMHSGALKPALGLMTHLAQADSLDPAPTKAQLALFADATRNFTVPKSVANSGGVLFYPESHYAWVRPGLILYGVSPRYQLNTGYSYGLLPVMTLSSHLAVIRTVKKGESIGYGGLWQAPTDMQVGIIPIGYSSGYPQMAPNGTPVLVKDKYCPVVGRVSMDMLTIDLTDCPQACLGDKVILWGPHLPVEIVACATKTSPWELLTRVSSSTKNSLHYVHDHMQ